MLRIPFLAVLVMSLSQLALCQIDDQDDWIDPGDMLNYDSGAKKMRPPAPETCEKCDCDEKYHTSLAQIQTLETNLVRCQREKKELTDEAEGSESCDGQGGGHEGMFFRQYIRSLLVTFTHEGSYQSQVTLTAADLATLHQFADAEGRVEDAHHVLLNMADHVIPLENPMYLSLRQKLENFLGIDLSSLFLVIGALMMCSITFSVLVRIHVPWSQILWKLFLALFIMSVPWNWWYLYKIAVAKRHADLLKEVPAECNPQDQSASQSLFQWVVSSFTFSEDACAKYHEKLLVDPIWEVPPTQALAVTFSKFFLEPLKHIGVAVKLMIRGLLEDMPIHMWPVVIFLFLFLTIFILVIMRGYRIKLFWNIFGLEPGHQAAPQQLPPAASQQPIQLVLPGAAGMAPHQPESLTYQGAIQDRPAIHQTDPGRQQPGSAVPQPHPAPTPRYPDTPDGGLVHHGGGAQTKPAPGHVETSTRPPTTPTEPHTRAPTAPVKAHTKPPPVPVEASTLGAEGVQGQTHLPCGDGGDGSHPGPPSGAPPPDTRGAVRTSAVPKGRPTGGLVRQHAVHVSALPPTTGTGQRGSGMGHGGPGSQTGTGENGGRGAAGRMGDESSRGPGEQSGMGDEPSVKPTGLPTQEEGVNTAGTPAVTAAAPAPSTQLDTEEDLSSFELLTPDGQSTDPVDVQPVVEDVGVRQGSS